MDIFELATTYWLPLVLFVFLALWIKSYLEKEQDNRKIQIEKEQEAYQKLAKEKMLLEVDIREKESKHLMWKFDIIVDRITDWNSEIMASNKLHSEEHLKIMNILEKRHWKIDIIRNDFNNDLKDIKKNVSDIRLILKK